MTPITVYSCVTGYYDTVNRTLMSSVGLAEVGVRYVLYTDAVTHPETRTNPNSNISWEYRPVVWKHRLCRRRTARWHKINSHLLPDMDELSVWVDGSQKIKPIAFRSELVEPLLGRYSLAAFKHPDRICAYQELQACIRLKKDNPELMEQQLEVYRQEGFPPYHGLVETSCVFRRNCPEVAAFNALWWEQLSRYSFRDQLSFNYVAWRLNQPYGIIPGRRDMSRFFEFVPHNRR
jgi:hypothetical protein